jgi:hypothetical protein
MHGISVRVGVGNCAKILGLLILRQRNFYFGHMKALRVPGFGKLAVKAGSGDYLGMVGGATVLTTAFDICRLNEQHWFLRSHLETAVYNATSTKVAQPYLARL